MVEMGENMEANKGYMVQEPDAGFQEARDFTSLVCWQDARSVRMFIYEQVLDKLPIEEKYNLSAQLRRAAISITLNMAEGYGRYYFKESIKFYRIARGSLYEVKDALLTCYDFQWISKEVLENGLRLIDKSRISLNGYIRYKEAQANNSI